MLYLRISMKPRKKKLEKKERSQSSSPETITRWIRNDDHKSWYWLNTSQSLLPVAPSVIYQSLLLRPSARCRQDLTNSSCWNRNQKITPIFSFRNDF